MATAQSVDRSSLWRMAPAIVTGLCSDMLTFLCKHGGGLKRRRSAQSIPLCCDHEITLLRRADLEAGTKLKQQERVKWARLGMHIFRRPGRRWTAALTPGEIRRAKEQLEAHTAKFAR